MSLNVIFALLFSWIAHELGHLGMAKILKVPARLKSRGIFGFAINMSMNILPWQDILVSLSGVAVNFVLLVIADKLEMPSLYDCNLLLMVGNLLPVLPLDGGRILRGCLALVFPWQKVTEWLIMFGESLAIAFAFSIVYFKLHYWLLILALWLYFVVEKERKSAEDVYAYGIMQDLLLMEGKMVNIKN